MSTISEWEDVTQQFHAFAKNLKMMEVLRDQHVTLEDCMQAQEINDDKMDPKFDIANQHTIGYKLDNGLVKLPNQISLAEIARVFANIIQLQACVTQGQPLFSSIYTFSYLYDRKTCQSNPLFGPLIESINTLGTYIYNLTKQAGTIKEDDVTVPTFSYSRNTKTHDEVIQLLLQAEKKYETENKKNYTQAEDKANFNFILNVLRLRRALHVLAKSMGTIYEPKNSKKIQTDLQSFKKRIAAVEENKYAGPKQLLQGVFLPDLHKTLRVHFGPRPLRILSFQQSLAEYKNAIAQLQIFIPTSTCISITTLKNNLQKLQVQPYNGWSKSYIKINLFHKQNYILSSIKSEDSLIADINDWVHLSQSIKNNEKFINMIRTAIPAISETLYRMLSNQMRWFWECSKIYQDFNVLIHISNEADAAVGTANKELYLSSWFYYYGLELMIMQMLTGFKINIYQPSEFKYVFYVLENILSINQRNSSIHFRQIDKSIIQNFNEGNFNKKQKKKLNENEKLMFSSSIFKKGLYLYIRALFKLLTILHSKNMIPNPFILSQQIRIKNRFRIFKNILFTKMIEYNEYKAKLQEISKRQPEMLAESLEQLKEVKNIYKLFITQLEEGEVQVGQLKDAEIIQKLSVKASIVCMSLKMGVTGKKFKVGVEGGYPVIFIQ